MITYRTDYDKGDKLFCGIINASLNTDDIIYLLDEEVDPAHCFFTWDNPITMLHITEDKEQDNWTMTCRHEGDDWLMDKFQKCDWYSLGYLCIMEKYGCSHPDEFQDFLAHNMNSPAWNEIMKLQETEAHLISDGNPEMFIQPFNIIDVNYR